MTTLNGIITASGHLADGVGDTIDFAIRLTQSATGTVSANGDADLFAALSGNLAGSYVIGGFPGTYTVPISYSDHIVTNINNLATAYDWNRSLSGLGITIRSSNTQVQGSTVSFTANAGVADLYGFSGSFDFGGSFTAGGGLIGFAGAAAPVTRPTTGITQLSFMVTRVSDFSSPESVAWSLAGTGDLPASAADFLGGVLPAGTISFPAGASQAVVNVTLAARPELAPGGTFAVSLHGASFGATLSADTAAGTIVSAAVLLPGQVKVAGPGSDVVSLQFADSIAAAPALLAAGAINGGVFGGSVLPFAVTPGAAIPALPAGVSGALVMHAAGSVALPLGYTAFSTDAAATVTGGAQDGQVILAGSAGLSFNGWLGAGSVIAAGGANLVSVFQGNGSQFIQLGAGDDTVVALGGDDTVRAGAGRNLILTGAGELSIVSAGDDLIAAGAIGNATITAGANDPVAFFGPGRTVFHGGSGHPTLVAGAGAATISAVAGAQVWLGDGGAEVESDGASTVIGGAGAATVTTNGVGDFVFGGSGALDFRLGLGSATILGGGGASTLRGGAGSLIALSYGTTRYVGGAGADTIAGFGGSLTVQGGGGAGLFLGGPDGHNSLAGGSGQSILLGGGDGDVLTAGSGAGDVLMAGPGAATLTGAGTSGAHRFYAGTGVNLLVAGSGTTQILAGSGAATMVGGAGVDLFAFAQGSGGSVVIEGFNPQLHYLSLIGFAAGEAAAALAGAVTASGSETLALSDGTHITLLGFSGLAAGNFL